MSARPQIYTIGHSTHPIDNFLRLLKAHGITVIADVRSSPYSRYFPQFNRAALGEYLKEHGIKYVFLGKELGARSDDPSCYVKGRVQYSRLAERAEFHEGIERLKRGASTHRIALMCAEREPLECHRTLLVSRALESEAFDIKHIHANGELEPHAEAMERLLDLVGLPREDLFRDKEDLLREALAVQESRVAYTNDDNAESEE